MLLVANRSVVFIKTTFSIRKDSMLWFSAAYCELKQISAPDKT